MMEDLISLRAGFDILSDDEFIQFIKCNDKKLIANILFQSFHLQLKHIQKMDESQQIITNIKNMKESISQIIRSRNKRNKSTSTLIMELDRDNDEEKIKLDDLPNIMISEISSYLNFECIINLEKCNRKIFIGTRSPINVYKLNANYFSKCWSFTNNPSNHYMIYQWLRFKVLKEIIIDIDSFFNYDKLEEDWICIDSKYELIDVLISNNFQKLAVIHSDTDLLEEWIDESEMNKFIDYIDNLKKSRFSSNIESIEFHLDPLQFDDDIKIRLDSIKYTKSNDIGNGIESLHLNEESKLKINEKYNNLKEICLSSPSKLQIDTLNQQNLQYLQRINCDFTGFCYNGFENRFCPLIGLLFKRDSVNYISLKLSVVKEEFKSVINILNESLQNMSSRKNMKIRISASNQYMGMDDNMSNDLLMILNNLNKKTDHFMLICDITLTPKYKNTMSDLLDKYKNKYSIQTELKMKLGVYFNKFIVSNQNCIINGYQESWIKTCYQCDEDTLFQ